MESFHEYAQYQSYLREQPLMAVYVYATDCGVCMVDETRTKQLCQELSFPFLAVNAEEAPEIAGQLNLFSLPAVVLYSYGKEYHRQARIVDFDALAKRMKELVEQV